MILWAEKRPGKSQGEAQLNCGVEGRRGRLCLSGLLSDWSEEEETSPSASLVSLI